MIRIHMLSDTVSSGRALNIYLANEVGTVLRCMQWSSRRIVSVAEVVQHLPVFQPQL